MRVIRKEIIKKSLTVYDISVENDKHYILDNNVISHNTMDMYGYDEQSGGGGVKYAADVTLMLTKAKAKEGTEHIGAIISLRVHKSRFMPENIKAKVMVLFKKGIQEHSYLLDVGIELGVIEKEGNSYILNDIKMTRKLINTNPKKFYTPEGLQILRKVIQENWSFGKSDEEIDLTVPTEEEIELDEIDKSLGDIA